MENSDEHSNTESENEYSEDNKCYNKEVLEEFYPTFNNYNVIIDGVRYPVFRKTVTGVKCMICKRNPDIPSIEVHVLLESHRNRSVLRTSLNKLKRFHDFWMELDDALQWHQQYIHRMKCLACDVQVDFTTIHPHIINTKHQRMIMLPFNCTKPEEEETSKPLLEEEGVNNLADSLLNLSVKSQGSNSVQSYSPSKQSNNEAKQKPSSKIESKVGEHIIKKSVANPNSPNILERIPQRYSNHVKFLTLDAMKNVFCKCCSKVVKTDVTVIKEHLDSKNHLKISNTPKHKMKFYCEICIKRYGMESSWDNHLMDLTHIARFDNLGKSRQGNITEHECLTCGMVIFGDQISLRRHKSAFSKKKSKELTLPRSVLQMFPSRDGIVSLSEKLLMEANKASHNQEKEKECCVALVRAVKDVYPMCKAYPFGSRVTGLGYCDSDLDVFLDIGDMYSGAQKQDPLDQTAIVNKVAKTLQKHRATFSDINKVAAARTPIVQVFHKDTNVDCDISFRHGLSVENTAYIRLCLDMQPILRPTMLCLKEWYCATNLSGLSSYALTMLMIFYLQSKGYLLSVKELRRINAEPSDVIDGWQTIKYTVSLQIMKTYVNICEYTVTQLLENFFEYYAKFDFEKWVICPLMGYLVPKTQFDGYSHDLPLEMSRYVIKLYLPNAEYFRNLTPMCVQDPFDLSHNVTKACGKDLVKKFQAYCNLTKIHMSALN